MARAFRFPKGEPLLDIASYARGGGRATEQLTPAQVEQIRRTVNRAPEVVVKVLPRASNDLKAVGKHLDYISRWGEPAVVPPDAAVQAYVPSVKFPLEPRAPGGTYKFFSSEAGRQILETEFLIAGVKIRGLSAGIGDWYRPLVAAISE